MISIALNRTPLVRIDFVPGPIPGVPLRRGREGFCLADEAAFLRLTPSVPLPRDGIRTHPLRQEGCGLAPDIVADAELLEVHTLILALDRGPLRNSEIDLLSPGLR